MDKQVEKNRKFSRSLFHAIEGIVTVVKEERNMKAHVCIASLTLFISYLSGLTAIEWSFILMCIFLVFVMEMMNTVVET